MRPRKQTEKGKPVARRGRKARGLASCETARPPVLTRKVRTQMFSLPLRRRYLGQLGLGLLVSAFIALPAQASADPSPCAEEEFSQAFLFAKDSNYYTLLPGESANNFEGAGRQLSGGARVVTEKLSDGSTGQVLDLPSGSTAVAPVICVTKDYPTARAM